MFLTSFPGSSGPTGLVITVRLAPSTALSVGDGVSTEYGREPTDEFKAERVELILQRWNHCLAHLFRDPADIGWK